MKTNLSKGELAKRIDHTILKPNADWIRVKQVCEEAVNYNFRGCCIPPIYLKRAKEIVSTGKVRLVTVVGFPLGYSLGEVKVAEVERCIQQGADDVDMVMSMSLFKSGETDIVRKEIEKAAEIAHSYGAALKVIIETSLLTPSEIVKASELVVSAGADFVKTNTGFGTRGVAPSDVMLIKKATAYSGIKIKAAGGIRTALDALLYISLGADVIGTSSGVKIINEYDSLLSTVQQS